MSQALIEELKRRAEKLMDPKHFINGEAVTKAIKEGERKHDYSFLKGKLEDQLRAHKDRLKVRSDYLYEVVDRVELELKDVDTAIEDIDNLLTSVEDLTVSS